MFGIPPPAMAFKCPRTLVKPFAFFSTGTTLNNKQQTERHLDDANPRIEPFEWILESGGLAVSKHKRNFWYYCTSFLCYCNLCVLNACQLKNNNNNNKDKTITLETLVVLVGRNSAADPWTVITTNNTYQDDTICWKGDIACAPFVLVYEEFIQYQYYSVNISFAPSPGKNLLGDVQWEV